MRARAGRLALGGAALAGFVYLFVPIALIVAFSFNEPAGRFNLVWQRFTLDNWLHPLARSDINETVLLSVEVALVATAASLGVVAVVRTAPVPSVQSESGIGMSCRQPAKRSRGDTSIGRRSCKCSAGRRAAAPKRYCCEWFLIAFTAERLSTGKRG